MSLDIRNPSNQWSGSKGDLYRLPITRMSWIGVYLECCSNPKEELHQLARINRSAANVVRHYGIYHVKEYFVARYNQMLLERHAFSHIPPLSHFLTEFYSLQANSKKRNNFLQVIEFEKQGLSPLESGFAYHILSLSVTYTKIYYKYCLQESDSPSFTTASGLLEKFQLMIAEIQKLTKEQRSSKVLDMVNMKIKPDCYKDYMWMFIVLGDLTEEAVSLGLLDAIRSGHLNLAEKWYSLPGKITPQVRGKAIICALGRYGLDRAYISCARRLIRGGEIPNSMKYEIAALLVQLDHPEVLDDLYKDCSRKFMLKTARRAYTKKNQELLSSLKVRFHEFLWPVPNINEVINFYKNIG